METRFTIFYDGNCGFCSRSILLILSLDSNDVFQFAPLQGDFAKKKLKGEFSELDTLVLLTRDGKCMVKFSAVRVISSQLRFPFPLISCFLSLIPKKLGDIVYDLIAKHRMRFSSRKACELLKQKDQSKFLL